MRKKCAGGDRAPVVELVGPRLTGPEEAARALRLSYGGGSGEAIVVLMCDDMQRVVLAIDFDGAPASGADAVLDCVVDAVPDDSTLVVGVFRPRSATFLDPHELEALEEVELLCVDAGIRLLDVIVLNELGWRSAAPNW